MTSPLYVGTGLTEPAPLQCNSAGREVFRITPDGEIEQEGRRITDDDAAVADALRELIRESYGLVVKPANRSHHHGELKPLEWRIGDAGRSVAESVFGRYDVLVSDNVWLPNAWFGRRCNGIEDGKALCQADYERRVAALFTKIGGAE